MDRFLVEIYLPATGKSYDVFIPRFLKIHEVIGALSEAIADLSGGHYVSSDDTALCEKDTGAILNVNITVEELGIKNGSKLMLI